jgi:hypothetical protein
MRQFGRYEGFASQSFAQCFQPENAISLGTSSAL